MKTLDDALAVLAVQEQEIQYCTIDPETREITVPDTYKILGVESDEDVERVYFKCPKIVGDNIDLSKLVIFVNYQNASGEKDRYYCDDVSVKGDEITFSWLISRKCAKAPGTIQFIVCAKKSVEEDVTNEWNTTIAESEILKGLEPETSIPEDQQDIVMQLIEKLNTLIEMGGADAPSFYINDEGHLIAVYNS